MHNTLPAPEWFQTHTKWTEWHAERLPQDRQRAWNNTEFKLSHTWGWLRAWMPKWQQDFFAGADRETSFCHNSVSSSPLSSQPPSAIPSVLSIHKQRLLGISVTLLPILTWRSWVSEPRLLPAAEEDVTGFTEREVYPWVCGSFHYDRVNITNQALHALSQSNKVIFLIPGRKMQVYSPDSQSDESLSSPILDADYIFPGPFASFLEEDLCGLSSLEAISSPSSTDGVTDLPNLSHDDIFDLPTEPLRIIEDSLPGLGLESGSVGRSSATGGSFLPRGRQADQERRRFSASELISRLQLSQRKNSFTLKLGKSLSARVASRDRQSTNSISLNTDCE